jgi:hypothetical protein
MTEASRGRGGPDGLHLRQNMKGSVEGKVPTTTLYTDFKQPAPGGPPAPHSCRKGTFGGRVSPNHPPPTAPKSAASYRRAARLIKHRR